MIRCLMLALTLMLITLSAAYIGRDEQLRQALRQTKIPITSSAEQPQSEASFVSELPESLSEPTADEPPRFVPDEPLEPAGSTAPPSSAAPAVIDPSAETRLYPVEDPEQQYIPAPPTEEQKLTAAEPFVKELFELTERNSEELKSIINQAVYDYLSTDPAQRSQSMTALMEKYTPIVLELESRSDSEAEAILLKMTAALTAIGADHGLVEDARAAYQHSKQQQTEHYTELISAFSPQ